MNLQYINNLTRPYTQSI